MRLGEATATTIARRRAIALAAVLVASLGCTDSSLKWTTFPNSASLRMQGTAKVCTPQAVEDDVPYKVLFVIDTSGSNHVNDPGERRHEAYLAAIERYAGQENIFFGIVSFSDAAHRPTVAFSQDREILLTAASAFTNDRALGATNYEDAIREMMDFIIDDLNASEDIEARKTQYRVIWISDGLPSLGTQDEDTLVANIRVVREYVESKAGGFRLDTLYLEPTRGRYTDDEITAASSLLYNMGETGLGTFRNITQDDATFEFAINPVPIVRPFFFRTLFVNNMHARYGSDHPRPDSDADGLPDDEEELRGTDPVHADTDGDGFRDGMEVAAVHLDPLRVDEGCDDPELDTDRDGLLDCEEIVLGTSEDRLDTDGDLLPDGAEVHLGASAVSGDPQSDRDLDQLYDWDEVAGHLDPLAATTKEEVDLWSYRYELRTNTSSTADGRSCHALAFANVGVFETLRTKEHPVGGQVIEIVLAYQTDDGAITLFQRATKAVGFVLPNRQNPATGFIELTDADFETLPPE